MVYANDIERDCLNELTSFSGNFCSVVEELKIYRDYEKKLYRVIGDFAKWDYREGEDFDLLRAQEIEKEIKNMREKDSVNYVFW